ncbi:unnamed protein product [Plutella xylostella]|uniref:(diamondback moth) hypothetical protein n=1 Tax=Plutella xylostella TaxID=51655 RepID=A0A8S4GAE1_PLUXY|nr:unnamed protein product [Plutella xylostella]
MANKVFLTKFKLQYDWLKNTLDMSNSKTHTSSVITARLRKLEDRYSALSEAYENLLINTDDSEIITMYDKEFREAEEWYNQLEARSAAYPNLDGTHVPTESTQTARLPPINLSVIDELSAVYVSRLRKSITTDNIKEYIRDMGQDCKEVELLQQNRDTDFNSFKITILMEKQDVFLGTEFWPSGVKYRLFRGRVSSGPNVATLPTHG